jgi:hypothetical protein
MGMVIQAGSDCHFLSTSKVSVFNMRYQIAVNTLKRNLINGYFGRLLPNSYPVKSP